MKLPDLKKEVKNELTTILHYWINYSIDEKYGGFRGRLHNDNTPDEQAQKGSVLNARILWSFSAASLVHHERAYTAAAKRAYEYIHSNFIDRDHGGIYWTLDAKGRPAETKKQVYAQAFTLYACSEYYKLTKDLEAKALAIELYSLLEKYSHDQEYGGYLEAFSQDWKLAEDLRLSEKDANEKKTMNTHLHVLEGYANLYTVWPEASLKNRIRNLLDVFKTKIIDSETGHLRLFFSDTWETKGSLVSYGHDIEASWLLLEAAEIIHDEAFINEYKAIAVKMANAVMKGMDTDGGLWYEADIVTGETIKEKHWWVQAEAMVGFLSAWQISGEQKFLDGVFRSWEFIKRHIIDKKNGEWFWGVKDGYTIMQEDKAGLWKCPYHNSRACLEVMKRII